MAQVKSAQMVMRYNIAVSSRVVQSTVQPCKKLTHKYKGSHDEDLHVICRNHCNDSRAHKLLLSWSESKHVYIYPNPMGHTINGLASIDYENDA
jgi:hypothetical protein